jgi:hypothetical protein
VSAPIVDFYDCHFRPDGLGELTRRKSDGAAANHERLFTRPQLASFNGMSSNSQRLDKRELIKRQQV